MNFEKLKPIPSEEPEESLESLHEFAPDALADALTTHIANIDGEIDETRELLVIARREADSARAIMERNGKTDENWLKWVATRNIIDKLGHQLEKQIEELKDARATLGHIVH